MKKSEKIFSAIYDQYVEKIYRFIFLKVNSQETAEDLCAETFLRLWQTIKKSENPGHGQKIENHSAFLYQIAKNLVIDHYREKSKTKIISAEYTPIADPRTNLEEKAILNSEINNIRKVLAELKEDYQNVIIWYYLDDLSIQEIAKMLGRSEEAVRVLVHRALKVLREKVNQSAIRTD